MLILAALAVLLVFLGLLRVSRRRGKNSVDILLCLQAADGSLILFVQGQKMKKISSSVLHFLVSIAALTVTGMAAALDGAIAVVSSDPNVLAVTPQNDGTFLVEVTGVGLATLTVSGDADLGDGIRTISQAFEFEVYDGETEADHFDLSITDITQAPIAEAVDDEAHAETVGDESTTS
ncbi:MAG: hypothetical protein ACXWAT_17280 [Methylobacter sp.]